MLPSDVLELAASQAGGIIDNRQLARLGYSSWTLTDWVRSGLIERLQPGHYRIATAPPQPDQDLHAVQRYLDRRQRNCLDPARPASIFTGGRGARLLGSDEEGLPSRPLALVEGRQVRSTSPGFDIVRTDLGRVRWRRVRDLRVAKAPRTLLDLAADPELPEDVLRRTGQDLLRLDPRLGSGALRTWLAGRRERGARRLLQLVDSGALDVESEMEWQLLDGLLREHPPVPDAQVLVGRGWRVDFLFVFAALAIEYYGKAWHRDRVDEDATRVHLLDREGLRVIVATRGVLRDADGFVGHVHELRREREALMLEGRLRRPALPPQPGRRVPLRTLVPTG